MTYRARCEGRRWQRESRYMRRVARILRLTCTLSAIEALTKIEEARRDETRREEAHRILAAALNGDPDAAAAVVTYLAAKRAAADLCQALEPPPIQMRVNPADPYRLEVQVPAYVHSVEATVTFERDPAEPRAEEEPCGSGDETAA